MGTLNVYLTDGFKDDRVELTVDGRKVFDESGITTKKLLGLAKQLHPITVDGDVARLEIQLPEKGQSVAFEAELSKGNHVPISFENGQLTHTVLKQIGFA